MPIFWGSVSDRGKWGCSVGTEVCLPYILIDFHYPPYGSTNPITSTPLILGASLTELPPAPRLAMLSVVSGPLHISFALPKIFFPLCIQILVCVAPTSHFKPLESLPWSPIPQHPLVSPVLEPVKLDCNFLSTYLYPMTRSHLSMASRQACT